MNFFDLVKEFVNREFIRAGRHELSHFERTVYWVQALKPDADEAMLIAAYAHDTERAFRDESELDLKDKNFKDEYFTKRHPQKGADIIGHFLLKHGAPLELVKNVASLISGHELGGDENQNVLKDADSLSFLEDRSNIDRFIAKSEVKGRNTIKEKFDWMYERISSDHAREFARPMYEEAIAKLEKHDNS